MSGAILWSVYNPVLSWGHSGVTWHNSRLWRWEP
jgi:hypothetical protein